MEVSLSGAYTPGVARQHRLLGCRATPYQSVGPPWRYGLLLTDLTCHGKGTRVVLPREAGTHSDDRLDRWGARDAERRDVGGATRAGDRAAVNALREREPSAQLPSLTHINCTRDTCHPSESLLPFSLSIPPRAFPPPSRPLLPSRGILGRGVRRRCAPSPCLHLSLFQRSRWTSRCHLRPQARSL